MCNQFLETLDFFFENTEKFLKKVITLLGVVALSVGLAQRRGQRRGEEGRGQNGQRGAGQAGQVTRRRQHFHWGQNGQASQGQAGMGTEEGEEFQEEGQERPLAAGPRGQGGSEHVRWANIASIAVSIFVAFLVDFYKYWSLILTWPSMLNLFALFSASQINLRICAQRSP